MPKYQITAPDGRKFEVNAPADASPDQVLAYAQQHFGEPEAAPAAWQPTKRTPEMLARSAAEYRDRNPVTNDMGGLGRFVAGAGKSLADTGLGLQQLVGLADEEDVDGKRQTDDALMNTVGGIGGNFVGSVSQVLTPGVVLKGASHVPKFLGAAPRINAAATAFLPTTIRGSAAQGAVVGGLQPVGAADSRLQNVAVGGALGSAGAAIPVGLGALRRGTGSFTGQVTGAGVNRRIGEIIRAEADNPAALAAPQPSIIPGVQRSLAEETLDPGLARLERNARSTGKGWDTIDRTNNAARVRALETFAGDDASIAAAREARSRASNQARREAMQIDGVDTTRLLGQIKRLETLQTGRPAVQSGLAQIRDLLTRPVSDAERRKAALAPLAEFVTKGRKSRADFEAAKAAMTAIRRGEAPAGDISSATGQAALKAAQKAFAREVAGHNKVAVLDNVRKTIGDMLSGKYGGDSAASLAGARELMAVKNQLDRVLAKQAPRYGEYLRAYRAGSVPINRMQIGQDLMGSRSGSAILDPVTGVQQLTPAAFSRNARNLDDVAARATGFRKAKARDYLRPEDQRIIAGVQDDLERNAFARSAGSGGNSQTFERMVLNDRVAGGFASRIPVVGRAFEYLAEVGQTRLQARLSEVLANPAQARAILAKLPANDRRTLELALSRAGGAVGATSPAFIE